MSFSVTDYIPHGMIAAVASAVTYVFREHVKSDDARFADVKDGLKDIVDRQTEISDKISDNHTEILRLLIDAGSQRNTQAAITEHAINRDRPPGRTQCRSTDKEE
jgi:hypothetical protein